MAIRILAPNNWNQTLSCNDTTVNHVVTSSTEPRPLRIAKGHSFLLDFLFEEDLGCLRHYIFSAVILTAVCPLPIFSSFLFYLRRRASRQPCLENIKSLTDKRLRIMRSTIMLITCYHYTFPLKILYFFLRIKSCFRKGFVCTV